MRFEKIRNSSGNDDFSDEYITVIVTSYFDSSFVKNYKKENKLRHKRVTHVIKFFDECENMRKLESRQHRCHYQTPSLSNGVI